jgi:excinuclease UvrABC ATPase subunit
MKGEVIKIKGARVHNLKNIDLELPKNKLEWQGLGYV